MVLSKVTLEGIKNLVHGGHGSLSERSRLADPFESAELGVLSDYLLLALLELLVLSG